MVEQFKLALQNQLHLFGITNLDYEVSDFLDREIESYSGSFSISSFKISLFNFLESKVDLDISNFFTLFSLLLKVDVNNHVSFVDESYSRFFYVDKKEDAEAAVNKMNLMDFNSERGQLHYSDQNRSFSWQKVNSSNDSFIILTDITLQIALCDLCSEYSRDKEKLQKKHKRLIDKFNFNEKNLLQISKITSLGEMAAGIAHELNNPITIIQGNYSLLEKVLKGDGDEKAFKFLKRIKENVGRISSVTNGIRKISRGIRDDETMENIPIKDIVQEVFDIVSEKFRANGVELEFENEANGCELVCHPTEISQVILNLVNNSYDAIKNNDEKRIWLTLKSKDNKVILSVNDSGMGIPKHLRKKIFTSYFTTKPVGEGTGIGITISQKILQKYKGQLLLDELALNTKFDIILPLKDAA